MPSGEACWSCLEAILPWLPVVLALSANSPWYAGELTGMASNRAPVLGELPRAGAPPAFASYAEWEGWVERLARLGVAEDYTRIWWDVRPHPKLGTLEVRVPDQPTDVHLSAALAALVQAMCATALEGALASTSLLLGDRGRADYAQNRWSAARFGPRASMLLGERYVQASELAAEMLEAVRPAARALGGEALLDRIDASSCEADLQLAFATPEEAAADLVARSLG
jgi:carboxylate-amine ligase